MSSPSIVSTLPAALRKEIDDRLRASGYGGLRELSAWLMIAHKVRLSKSALHRYAQSLCAIDAQAGEVAAQAKLRGLRPSRSFLTLLDQFEQLANRQNDMIHKLRAAATGGAK